MENTKTDDQKDGFEEGMNWFNNEKRVNW
jgi:hypothetical protein